MSYEVNPALFNSPWGPPPPNTPALPAVATQSPKVTPESVATSAEATSAKADATLSKWSAKVGFDDAQSSSHAERVALAAAISAKLSPADKQQFANKMLAASSGALNFGLRGAMAAPTPATAGPVAAPQPTAPAAPASPVPTALLTSSDPQQAAKLADITSFLDRIKTLLGATGNAIADQVLKAASSIKVPEGGAVSDADFKTLLKTVDTARQQTLEAVRVGGAEVVKKLSTVSAALSGVPNTGELKAAVEQAKTGWQNLLAAIDARKPFSLEQVEKLNASTGNVINEANKFMASSKASGQPPAAVPAPAPQPAPVATATPTMYAVGTNAISTAGGKPNPTEALTQSKGFADADKLAAKEAADEKENAEKAEAASGDR